MIEKRNRDPGNNAIKLPKNWFPVIATNDRLWDIPKLIRHFVLMQGYDLVLDIVPEAHSIYEIGLCDLLDQFNFKSVTIYTWNELEKHDKYNIVLKTPKFFFAKNIWEGWAPITEELYKWSGKYRFSAYYGRPTADRLGFAAHLYSNYENLTDMGLMFDPNSDNHLVNDFELEKLFLYDNTCLGNVAKLMPHLPYKPGLYNPPYWYYENPLIYRYKDTLIDIVSEPNIAGNTFFFTEKLVRAMILKRPFVRMAGRDSLCYLRQMGFQTFHNFFDEDYDGYDNKERYLRIIKLIDDIANLTNDQLNDMYNSMQTVLEHNWKLLQEQTYSEVITPL